MPPRYLTATRFAGRMGVDHTGWWSGECRERRERSGVLG